MNPSTLPAFQRPPREPDIEAEISAVPTDQGGRRHPLFSGYRPNHDFRIEGELNDAMHEYPDNGCIEPGCTGRAFLWLLSPERQSKRLHEGFEFTVKEGSRIVGHGRITRVLNHDFKKIG